MRPVPPSDQEGSPRSLLGVQDCAMTTRPFRFGLQAFEATTAEEWFGVVRRTEELGYSTLFSSDHYFGPGPIADTIGHRPVEMGPLTSIAVAAAMTSTLKVGCRVFACDFHHPVVLAKEMATLDLLSGGRLEVGLGAGWTRAEYDGLGVHWDGPGTRIERLSEYVDAVRAHWTGEPIEAVGKHVNISGFSGRPLPHTPDGPPIMIGGGAPKILGLAGQKADIVSLNFNNAAGKLGGASVATSDAAATMQKIGWIRDGAEIGAYFIAIGETGIAQRDAIAGRFGVDGETLAQHPHGLFGTTEQICETLIERRETYGISYVTVAQRHLEEFAPVVAALTGK
jgi:probable F420-dependent oxidoreductase